MTTSIFLSYSRREAPFVDSLANALEALNYHVWLDYRSLVPARPWAGQIDDGIVNADVVVLLVSKEALASEYVGLEWQRAIELNKRIVLALFEAVPLPPDLAAREWVDLRGNFGRGVAALSALIETPAQPERPAPQRGFRTEPAVWAAVIASVPVALLSLLTIWTVYLPLHLLPLPLNILKRKFNFFHVQTALLMLPLSMFFTAIIFAAERVSGEMEDMMLSGFALSFLFGLPLIFLLRSTAMQRWGKPIATRPKRPAKPRLDAAAPDPLRFAIDFAPEDKKYADAISRALIGCGHTPHPDIHTADTTLVLLSGYKTSSPCTPETHVVFPLLLQTTDNINPTLAQIQWVDYRRGLANLEALGQMLGHPGQLLRTLGATPGTDQMALPLVISVLVNFQTLLAIFSVAGVGTWIYQFGRELTAAGPMAASACFMGVLLAFCAIIFTCNRALMHRQGRAASWLGLVSSAVLIGILMSLQFIFTSVIPNALGIVEIDGRGLGALIGPVTYILGLIIVIPVMLWFRQDLMRWFPVRTPRQTGNS